MKLNLFSILIVLSLRWMLPIWKILNRSIAGCGDDLSTLFLCRMIVIFGAIQSYLPKNRWAWLLGCFVAGQLV